MPVRHDDDPGSGHAHIDGHNVAEYEVEAVPDRPLKERHGEGGVSIAAGKRKEAAIDASF